MSLSILYGIHCAFMPLHQFFLFYLVIWLLFGDPGLFAANQCTVSITKPQIPNRSTKPPPRMAWATERQLKKHRWSVAWPTIQLDRLAHWFRSSDHLIPVVSRFRKIRPPCHLSSSFSEAQIIGSDRILDEPLQDAPHTHVSNNQNKYNHL